MAGGKYSQILFYLSLFGLCYGQDVCVQKTPCSCMFSNGTGIDLSSAAVGSFYPAQMYMMFNETIHLKEFFYHPCTDAVYKNAQNASDPNNTCIKPLSLCVRDSNLTPLDKTAKTYKLADGSYNFLGSNNYTDFGADGRSITYHNGPSVTEVKLFCTDTETKLYVYSLSEPNDLLLAFYSKEACLKQMEESGRSLGSTLLIIFFSLVIFYLVLGILTRKFLMGATGLEVIPNHNFWSDLPNLVKDGWAFARNGFQLPNRGATGPTLSPDPNSYDSI